MMFLSLKDLCARHWQAAMHHAITGVPALGVAPKRSALRWVGRSLDVE